MDLQEFYLACEGNYQNVKSRLVKEALIQRLVIKFLDDDSYEKLLEAMEQKDYGMAFRAVHTLKGLSQNFSFDRLSKSTSALTEVLRKWESEPVDEEKCELLWRQVSIDYMVVTSAIRKLKENVETE
ncbi:MAG: Hpt domain-containing protein [Lachnospiraceae bacterium]|nr:Hpt domain-containing protein [Lachnospiraceae bacterium]